MYINIFWKFYKVIIFINILDIYIYLSGNERYIVNNFLILDILSHKIFLHKSNKAYVYMAYKVMMFLETF